jgi:Flp pilus assembly protein TadD
VSAPKICPTCSAEYPATERFCPKDGTALRSRTAAAADLAGSVIAERYHVLRKLGEGGMGQVYLAEHVKMGRQSAVKVMHSAMVHDADAIGRFNREAANASRIDHPNVAGIYDFGETPEGLVYLAMQYVEGETLTQMVRANGALPPVRAAEITRQAAEGLHAAHGMGIVHRDLKPDNIMVTKDADGLDCVKVVDFGIAKAAGNASQKVTRTGTVVGTPEYMSPEQLAGEEVDARSDLYSLALVAFNMLTGDLPFPAVSTQTSMIMRLTDKPKSLAEMKPDVAWPAEVQAVMSKALEREASERYATTREFGRALHAAIEKMPVRPTSAKSTRVIDAAALTPSTRVVGPSSARSTQITPRKRSRMIAMAGVGALVIFVAGALAARGAKAASRRASSAAIAQGITAYREGWREAAAERFRTAASKSPNNPMPHVYLSRMAREANDLTTANDEAVKAVQLGPDNGAALRELASTLFVQQNFTGARTFYTRAIKADPNDRLSQGFLGCSLIRLGRVEEGMRWIQRAGNGSWTDCAAAPGTVAAGTR